jgi:hypothetical protein
MEDAVSIKGLNKAEVLAALYNASRPLGMGFLQYNPKPMTQEEAQKMLDSGRKYFDYVNGRVMKISLGSDGTIDPLLYDRENGDGAVKRVVEELRRGKGADSAYIKRMHREGSLESADVLKRQMNEEGSEEIKDGISVVHMGFGDVKDVLAPKVDEVVSVLKRKEN